MRTAVSTATGSPAAPAKSSDGGIGAYSARSASSAAPPPPAANPNTLSPIGHVGHAVAELVDDAGDLAAGALRQVAVPHPAAHLPVDRVDACGADRHPDLAGRRMGIRQLD